MFIKKHLDMFKSTVDKYFELPEEQRWAGGYATVSLSDYLQKKCLDLENLDILPSLSTIKFNRVQLIERADFNSGISNLEIVLDIFAWGGINRKHACWALESFKSWEPLIEELRQGLSSFEAYDKFHSLRTNNLRGIGPAYYTKLIFFCQPKHDGYIMDQWTARSVNLLLNRPFDLIKLNKSKYFQGVSDYNDKCVYKKFCCNVESLAKECGYDEPKEIEEALFSKGGHKKLDWRKYVIQNS
tara:strand:+ start:3652 stop:4377 length:726 start_codon:yes stop_codon:yes gene_type:complete